MVGLCRSSIDVICADVTRPKTKKIYLDNKVITLVKSSSRLPLFNIQLEVSTLYVSVATIPFRSLLVSRMELGGSPHQHTQVSFILTLLSYARKSGF
jgi:hypothetical protein